MILNQENFQPYFLLIFVVVVVDFVEMRTGLSFSKENGKIANFSSLEFSQVSALVYHIHGKFAKECIWPDILGNIFETCLHFHRFQKHLLASLHAAYHIPDANIIK